MRAVPLLSLLLLAGCSERPPPPTAPLAAGTGEEAALRVRAFLDAYQAADVDRALGQLCEADASTRAFLERSLAPGSPFRIERYDVTSVTALWEQKTPLFLVMVRMPRAFGEPLEHGYRVRATEGCLERLFGDPWPSSPRALPPPSPPGPEGAREPADEPAQAPRDERSDDDEPWGPPLPAAPTAPGDKIIDL